MSLHQVATPLFQIHPHTLLHTIKHKRTSLSMPDSPPRNESTSNPHTVHPTLPPHNPPATSSLGRPISSYSTAERSRSSRSSRVHDFLNPPEVQQGPEGPHSPTSGGRGAREGELRAWQAASTHLPSLMSVQRTQESLSPRESSGQSQQWNLSSFRRRGSSIDQTAALNILGPTSLQSSSSNIQSMSPATPPLSQPTSWHEGSARRHLAPFQDPNRPASQSGLASVSVDSGLALPITTPNSSMPATQVLTPDFGQTSRAENIAAISNSTRALVQAEEGALGIPIDIQAASRSADEKRRRNAGASARFRARRKEREQANTRELDDLRQQIRDLTEDSEFYRRERDYFSSLVYQSPDRDRHFPRPRSPRHRRSSCGTAPSFSETSPPPAESYYQEQPGADPPTLESGPPRKRARGGKTASASVSSVSSPIGSHQASMSHHLPSFATAGERYQKSRPSSSSSSLLHPEQQSRRYSTSASFLPPLLSEQMNPPTGREEYGHKQQQRPSLRRGGSHENASHG